MSVTSVLRAISIATDAKIEQMIRALPNFDACFIKEAIVHLRNAEGLIKNDIKQMQSADNNTHRLRARQGKARVEIRLSPEDMAPPVRAAIPKGLLIAVKEDGMGVQKPIGRIFDENSLHMDRI